MLTEYKEHVNDLSVANAVGADRSDNFLYAGLFLYLHASASVCWLCKKSSC